MNEHQHLLQQLDQAVDKLRSAMDHGPSLPNDPAPDVVLTAEQATLIYRLLTERR